MVKDEKLHTSITNDFNDYLKIEYKHIAEAHFRTIAAISSFFRYYLLIMSAPLTVFSLIVGLSSKDVPGFLNALDEFRIIVIIVLFVIAFVGFAVMLYIISLRMDVILYARTINSIRKSFYDNSGLDIATQLHTRVLPQSSKEPSYQSNWFFLPVVVSFSLLNSLYFLLAVLLWSVSISDGFLISSYGAAAVIISTIVFLFGHIGFYYLYANHRDRTYLRYYNIGVDVDGVLNMHKDHFAKLLNQNCSIQINPQDITTIPLHNCKDQGVTDENEYAVFNDPRYWLEMPELQDAAKYIEKIKNLNIKVFIFTNRPWPNTSHHSSDEGMRIRNKWEEQANRILKSNFGNNPCYHIRLWIGRCQSKKLVRLIDKFGLTPIKLFTVLWLREKQFKSDYLLIERGSEAIADPRAHFRNRFYLATKKKIKFFVEDDIEKAIKLAYICDVVFLVNHPYNQNIIDRCSICQRECKQEIRKIPSNVLRVNGWDEIYNYIKRLS